ncbi:ABC transporter permease [Alphaproteobacteria bacterium]|nr:ABC transporter permease [Alphaproteobacteria bacterium]
MLENFTLIILLIDSTFRISTPLIFAALAGLFAERAGIVDIGLEGKLLGSAFAAACIAAVTGSSLLGLCAGLTFSVLLSLIHGFACITHRGDQVVSGMAINIFVAGLAPTLALSWFHIGGQTPALKGAARFSPINLPFSESISNIPYLGLFYSELISGHNIFVYLAFIIVPLVAWIVFKTRFGLRLRAVGENPQAVDTAGLSVHWIRYQALIITGILCGFGGSYLSIAQTASFIRDMSAGQGFLALAALIFGKWKPWPTLFACLLFGFTDAVQTRLQGVDIPGIGVIPVQFIQALPYVLTVVLLAGFVGKAIAPKASGIPYNKEN